MLKALELNGFKSFADRTRFDFPAGITVVVGPNGSGKSNVVDAIKWVLGEQSVKSLRGKEMADVIFNGSGSRKAINSAEATLTFDNSAGILAVDTPDVHITRRVYRSGEGEYLINRQPCRLRDIRDLFAGTGAATEAYSVIEQGKVDVLLQSSPRDRRVIFEEAAGISRFKMKKIEAMRRLERVDQNLLRLSDIVEEVDSRLRSVRMQASKARRYREFSERLQELRTQVGLSDWRALTQQLSAHEQELASLQTQVQELGVQLETDDARSLELEAFAGELDESIRAAERRIAGNRERIAACESTIEHERTRSADLDEEISRHRRSLFAMNTRAGDLEQQLSETSTALGEAEAHFARIGAQLENDETALAAVTSELSDLRKQADRSRTAHLEEVRKSTALSSRISAQESQAAAAEETIAQRKSLLATLTAKRDQLAKQLAAFQAEQTRLALESQQSESQWKASQAALSASRRMLSRVQSEVAQLEGRHAGAVQRASVLSELEKRLEGLSAGVKEILGKARESSDGPFRQVRGLVADLFNVSVDTAPLIEVALGDLAQHLVVAPGSELIDYLESEGAGFTSRVGFVFLEPAAQPEPNTATGLNNAPGVVSRADRLVETQPEFAPLAKRLLSRTWIVETLADARRLASGPGRGHNFVTRSGEFVGQDGTIAVGPKHAATGLISRRSELRALRGTIGELEAKLIAARRRVTEMEQQIGQEDERLANHAAAHQNATDALREQKHRSEATAAQLTELAAQIEAAQTELIAAEQQNTAANSELEAARREQAATETLIAGLEGEVRAAGAKIEELDTRRARLNEAATSQQVQLAKSEQRLEGLRQQTEQLQRDQQERSKALGDTQRQLASCQQRASVSRRTALQMEAEVAELYLQKEQLALEVVEVMQRREAARQDRAQIVLDAQQIRARIRKLEEKLHGRQLDANQVQHQRVTMAERLRDDYGIELAELEHEPTDEEEQARESVEEEIAELRRKLNNIGNVNLTALDELDELEARYGSLSTQYEDLSKAKASLEQIINKINADSRRLFSETLEIIRGHFQGLFRKLFGGGHGDIILDEDQDILDSGIEIVARPPGKELRSISLLSGGEKTMTCVALLMAIFRSRPSPFCVLDEVDAALDEANIERFVNVVQEFLGSTQFIIITHSKKTMTCAGTLYGVTMQESGISKRVSVRFEDVSEDGHIHQSAIDRHDAQAADEPAEGTDETQAA